MIIKHFITVLIPVVFILYLATSCNNGQDKKETTAVPGKNEMADLNRYFVTKDRERIQNYIERKNLEMVESATGLWYMIQEEGKGEQFTDHDQIIMSYECFLLDGTECYSTEDLGPKEIILGRSELEQGLNEGIRMLRPGAEATFILPPYMAFGLIGDRGKIPPRAIIIYHIVTIQRQGEFIME